MVSDGGGFGIDGLLGRTTETGTLPTRASRWDTGCPVRLRSSVGPPWMCRIACSMLREQDLGNRSGTGPGNRKRDRPAIGSISRKGRQQERNRSAAGAGTQQERDRSAIGRQQGAGQVR